MQMKIFLLSAATLMTLGSSLAFAATKEVREFPSNAIRPLVSSSNDDRQVAQSPQERRVTPLAERTTPPNPRACARPYVGRDAVDNAERRNCQPENSVNSGSDIPQFRAFRQPSTQKFAP